jgi:co-chaperonin GroES (HSP10)
MAKADFHYGKQTPDNFEVLGDRYLVEVLEISDYNHAGIVLIQKDENQRGWLVARIAAVGNGHRLERDEYVPMFYKVGDVVFMERLTGKDFKLGGLDYRILSQIDVLARVSA